MAAKLCIMVPRTFLVRTKPPYNKATPGIISRTSVVETNIQAVVPVSMDSVAALSSAKAGTQIKREPRILAVITFRGLTK